MKLSQTELKDFQETIFNYYRNYGRDFPWRNTTDPYKILVSEFLLQKTHVRKVEEIFVEFIKRYPSTTQLANAEINEVKEIIQPLGFLNRASRMIQTAKKINIEFDKRVPEELEALMAFHGIGRYIAAAVMVFAFEKIFVVVDTNVIKVLEHALGYSSNKKRPRTDKALWDYAQTLAPENDIKAFNWGLLDYGANLKT
jgi:A/G-specific adenine glycosylase